MTFDEVLDQVRALLKRQGRVSYSALKRRFDLDDDYLNDLKDELLYVHPVRDDEGRGLVWTGNAAGIIDTPAPPPQAIPAPLIQEAAAVHPPSPLGTSRTLDAERRQLTVMFCDVVDSTLLAGRLDPEEYRDVVRAYHTVCTEVIRRYDGHIAQLLGDGLVVYFGYPHAHEDDARRAVYTGLGIVEAMAELNRRCTCDRGIRLAVRIGIHTGVVVVRMRGRNEREALALGNTSTIADQVQGLAGPDTVVISPTTLRLVERYVDVQALGTYILEDPAEPVAVAQIRQVWTTQRQSEIMSIQGRTPLVGREQEMALLRERWAQVKEGWGQ